MGYSFIDGKRGWLFPWSHSWTSPFWTIFIKFLPSFCGWGGVGSATPKDPGWSTLSGPFSVRIQALIQNKNCPLIWYLAGVGGRWCIHPCWYPFGPTGNCWWMAVLFQFLQSDWQNFHLPVAKANTPWIRPYNMRIQYGILALGTNSNVYVDSTSKNHSCVPDGLVGYYLCLKHAGDPTALSLGSSNLNPDTSVPFEWGNHSKLNIILPADDFTESIWTRKPYST